MESIVCLESAHEGEEGGIQKGGEVEVSVKKVREDDLQEERGSNEIGLRKMKGMKGAETMGKKGEQG